MKVWMFTFLPSRSLRKIVVLGVMATHGRLLLSFDILNGRPLGSTSQDENQNPNGSCYQSLSPKLYAQKPWYWIYSFWGRMEIFNTWLRLLDGFLRFKTRRTAKSAKASEQQKPGAVEQRAALRDSVSHQLKESCKSAS